MALFEIRASETVYYAIEVEANSEAEALAMANGGEVDWGDPYDGDHFQIDRVAIEVIDAV